MLVLPPRYQKIVAAVWIPAALALLTLLFMLPFLRPPTGNEVLNGHDLLYQQYPLYSFIFDSVRDGHGLPLWSPYQFAGQSIVANPQSTIFYPPAWMMAVLGVPRGVGWLVVLHLWLGGWGLAAFTRQLGASPAGAFAGGIVYMFSGVLAAHLNAGHVNYLLCAAWLPWLAAAYLWAIARPQSWFAALPGAAAFGMVILSGHPPLLYFGGLWLSALFIYVIATQQANWWQALRPLLLILIIGALLGAALLLPVAEFTRRSTRTQSGLEFSNSFALPAAQLLTLFVPNLFGEPSQGYWGLPFYEELTVYVGLLPLIALFLVRWRAAAVLLGTLVLAGLVVSVGLSGGLFTFLYDLLPGYSLFRVPPRALYFVTVGAAGLAALLFTDLPAIPLEERTRHLRPALRVLPLLLLLLIAAALTLSLIFTLSTADQTPFWRMLSSANHLGLAALAVGASWLALRLWTIPTLERPANRLDWRILVLLVVILVDVWHIAAPLVTVSAVDVPEMWQTLAQTAPASPDFRVMTVPNTVNWQAGAVYTRHLNSSGYDPLVSDDYQRLLDASGYNPASPIAALLGVRYVLTDKPLEWSGLPNIENLPLLAQNGDWHVYETAASLPRAFITPALTVLPDAEARQRLASGDLDPLTAAVVAEPTDCPGGAANTNATITTYTPNVVEVHTQADQPGILVLTDSYDPYWTVTIDGSTRPLLRVDTALRGVCLPAGDHQVRFEYQPRLFYLGVLISAISWLGLAVISLIVVARQLAAKHTTTPDYP
ncbi:MAG TPA: YfhO family protein [Phototrophicaceae bacterium]|nr:YfhO family protein [Phototrophicaceae bacterium]